MKVHNVITVKDENNRDQVGEYLDALLEESFLSVEAKIHYTFLQQIFELLEYAELQELCNEPTELIISVNGFQRTKRYRLIKPLRRFPIYEVRYAMSGNEHLRLLFFTITYKNESYYVFVKAFVKTRIPNVDETNQMRDLTYGVYLNVLAEPNKYLEDDES